MDQKLAVLFMPDDMTLTKEQAPLMLRPILFCPILTWMVEELMGRGIERFFIVSDKRAHDMMRPYVPENADVVYVGIDVIDDLAQSKHAGTDLFSHD